MLEVHDARQAHGAGLYHDTDDRQHQRQLVGDQLPCGAEAAEQRVLVGRRPARHEHADDRQRRDGQGEEHAGVEVFDHEPRAGGDDDEQEERRDEHDRGRHREDRPVGLVGDDVLLLDELYEVADELVPAVEAPGLHGPQAALHVGHGLHQEDIAEHEPGQRDNSEDDPGLDRRLRPVRQADRKHQRSMSPRMK
jgi:hypothetical protein